MQVCFLDDEAGVFNIIPDELCLYGNKEKAFNKSSLILKLANGSKIRGFSAQKPKKLRGKNLDAIWFDELCFFEYPREVLVNAKFATRKGKHRMFIVTTTPRPIQVIKDMVKDDATFVTRGSTYENADNLNPEAIRDLEKEFEGTAMGRQELYAEILESTGTLFRMDWIEPHRRAEDKLPKLQKVVVGFDPAVTNTENSDKHGIVVVGKDFHGHFYVLGDYTMKGTPNEASQQIVDLYNDEKLDVAWVVAEVNNGGDYIAQDIHAVDPNVIVKDVRATRGKARRAQPVSNLYQQGKVHHVGVGLAKLEDEMCNFSEDNNEASPDRMDALVWAITSLNNTGSGKARWSIH